MQRRRFFASLGWLATAASAQRALAASPAAADAHGASTHDVPPFSDTNAAASVTASPSGSASASATLRAALARIEAIDRKGPRLNSIIELNPDAAAIARTLDREQRDGKARGPLHGALVVIKDNVATGDRMATSAGSLALDGVRATRDAHLIARLRAAGAVIVGKANLSEWANIRSTRATSGWSGRGGLTRNPYGLDRNTSGSSSGSAAAVAAGLVPMAIGTETDGSIVSPASINGVVGLKPTVGRVSRDGIIPISHTQDTAGPIARTVTDAARLLAAIAGPDPRDSATLNAPPPDDYVAALDPHALRGARIGVARNFFTGHDEIDQQTEQALAQLIVLGAELVDPIDLPKVGYADAELAVLLHEFKHGLPLWLAAFAPHAPVRDLAELIAFNEKHRDREMPYFGQELFTQAQALGDLNSDAYRQALDACRKAARDDGLARVLREHRLDAIVAPTGGTAWLTDFINGDSPGEGFSTPAAVAGYPHLTVPSGFVRGLPIGLSFVGAPWSEARLLAFGYAFERATERRRDPRFIPSSSVPQTRT